MSTALIAGGSGLVGGKLLQQLLDCVEYTRVVALVRRPLPVTHSKLEQVIVDFAALDKATMGLQCDDAFCCLGTTIKEAGSREKFRAVDHGAVLAFAWAAQRSGARRFFVVSSLGANADSRVFYSRIKGETEDALTVLGFGTLAIFQPSLLLGSRLKKRAGEKFSEKSCGCSIRCCWVRCENIVRSKRTWLPVRCCVVHLVAAIRACSFFLRMTFRIWAERVTRVENRLRRAVRRNATGRV